MSIVCTQERKSSDQSKRSASFLIRNSHYLLTMFPIHSLYLGGHAQVNWDLTEKVKSEVHFFPINNVILQRTQTIQLPAPPTSSHRCAIYFSVSPTLLYLWQSTTLSTVAVAYWLSIFGAVHHVLTHSRPISKQHDVIYSDTEDGIVKNPAGLIVMIKPPRKAPGLEVSFQSGKTMQLHCLVIHWGPERLFPNRLTLWKTCL